MKYLLFFLFVTLTFTATADDFGDIEKDLTSLKELCDKQLITEDECKQQRIKILAKLSESKKEPEKIWYCNYGGEQQIGEPILTENGLGFSESASANTIVREILEAAGLVGNFVVRAASVPNAAATVRMGNRYIEYNPNFVQNLKNGSKTNWSVYSVLAHEIGHHLQGHTFKSGGSRPDIELEADEYSGFILAQMGASLNDAQKAMRTFGSDSSSGTHPNTKSRLDAIKKGWDKGHQKKNDTPKTSINSNDEKLDSQSQQEPKPTIQTPIPNPIPVAPSTTFLYKCVIQGEMVLIDQANRVMSVPRNGLQVGQRVPANHPNCAFNIASPPVGIYCVAHTGVVYFGAPFPVGQCVQCGPTQCN